MREGWTYKKLGDICIKGSSNISLNKIEDNIGDYPLYGASGYVKGIDFYHQASEYVGIIKDGAGVGRVNLYPAYSSLVGTMQYILPKENCHIGFLKYLLQGMNLGKMITGATIPHIYFKDYSKNIVPVPSLQEQQQIVSELDLLSSVIEKQKAQIEELDKLAQSIFYDMFGDPVENEKGWEVKKLGVLSEIKGRVGWKGYKKTDLRSFGPYVLGATHLGEDGNVNLDDPVYISREKYEESPEIYVNKGDVILAQRGSIGKVALVREDIGEATINPCVLIVRPEKIQSDYLVFFFLNNHVQEYLTRMNTGGVQPMITQKQVKCIDIPLPPLSLQQEFANKIQAIESMKAKFRQSLKESETLFNSRMDYYFS